MNEDPLKHPPVSEMAARGRDAVKHTAEAVTEAAEHATEAAQHACHDVSLRAGDTLGCSRAFVRRNPLSSVFGALVCGAALGGLIVLSQRRQPTLRERFAGAPVDTSREAINAALAPLSLRLHEGYDAARGGAHRAMKKIHHIHPSRRTDSWTDQIGRAGNNLKFW